MLRSRYEYHSEEGAIGGRRLELAFTPEIWYDQLCSSEHFAGSGQTRQIRQLVHQGRDDNDALAPAVGRRLKGGWEAVGRRLCGWEAFGPWLGRQALGDWLVVTLDGDFFSNL